MYLQQFIFFVFIVVFDYSYSFSIIFVFDYFLSQFYETYFTNGEKHFLCHDDVDSKQGEALHEPNKINPAKKHCNGPGCYLKAAFLMARLYDVSNSTNVSRPFHVVVEMTEILLPVKFYLNERKQARLKACEFLTITTQRL